MRLNVGIGPLTALVFTILKLCGVITWSWWWVLCPIWIPAIIALACLGLAAAAAAYGKHLVRKVQKLSR